MSKNFKIQNQILNMKKVKKGLNKSNAKSKFLTIAKNTKFRKIYHNILFPQKDMPTFQRITENINNYKSEMLWHVEILSVYKGVLSNFLIKTEEYSKEYFNGNYEACKSILTEIEELYGNSVWLIENKINLFNILDKEEAEKYYESIQNSELNTYYKFLAWILNIKSDELVSPARFEIELQRMVQNWMWVKKLNLSNFLLFHFSLSEEFGDTDLNSLLNVLENLSLVDRYFTLLKITEKLIDNSVNIETEILTKLYTTLDSIDSKGFSPYFRVLMSDVTSKENPFLNNALDLYTKGDYQKVIEICNNILESSPNEIDIYEIYTKSLLNSDILNLENPNGKWYIEIINMLLDIYSSKNRVMTEEKIDRVLKICISHNTNKWAWKLISLITNQKYGTNIFNMIPNLKDGFKYSAFLKPQILFTLFEDNFLKDKYIELNFEKDSITQKLHNAYSDLNIQLLENIDIEKNRRQRILGNIFLLKREYQEALYAFNQVDNNESIYVSEVIKGKINSYIGLGEFEIALNLLVDSYLEAYEVIHDIDLVYIYESVMDEEYSYSNINVLIFLELLTRYSDNNLEIKKHNFLEDFLLENNVFLISEMQLDFQIYPKEKLIFVLKEYCTIDNMSQYHHFENYEQVEEERIKICRILTQIDPENKNLYSEEILELTEKLQIRVHTAALEKSKIYVDTEGIKKQAVPLIENNFNRISEYFNSTKSKGLPLEVYINPDNNIEENTFKKNSYFEIYNEMIFHLRDTFIYSKQYGLNVYLSLGIRHGTIIAQFRKLFEKDHFVTLFDSYENKYKNNNYWLEKLQVNPMNKQQIVKAFNAFNKRIDELLNTLKDAKLQVSTDPKDNIALFNYYIPKVELMMLYINHATTENLNSDLFIEQIIDELWRYTERNLNSVRQYLNSEFKKELLNAINEFLGIIEEINNKSGNHLNLQEFNNKVIDLRTEIEYQIKYVSNWFTKENIVDIDNFTLQLPLNIALEYIKSSNFNVTINPNVNINPNDLKVKGKYLKWFNELFYTVIDNILKRSGFHNVFEFDLEIKKNGEFLQIECINPLELDSQEIQSRKVDLKNKLSEIKYISVHEESNILARASEEGGSGLYKIVKVLRYDIKTPTFNLDFGIDDNDRYFIFISLDMRGILFENINS